MKLVDQAQCLGVLFQGQWTASGEFQKQDSDLMWFMFLKDHPGRAFLFVCFYIFGHAAQHVGYQPPNQGANPHPLHWKCAVLTTGPPGKSCSGGEMQNGCRGKSGNRRPAWKEASLGNGSGVLVLR